MRRPPSFQRRSTGGRLLVADGPADGFFYLKRKKRNKKGDQRRHFWEKKVASSLKIRSADLPPPGLSSGRQVFIFYLCYRVFLPGFGVTVTAKNKVS